MAEGPEGIPTVSVPSQTGGHFRAEEVGRQIGN